MSSTVLLKNDMLLQDSKNFLMEQRMKLETKENIYKKLEELNKELESNGKTLDDMIRAATILGNVADENTQFFLKKITDIINSALAKMFIEDKRKIYIKQEMYKNVYPHFKVELETEDGQKRTFSQSGTGLAQVISFLFSVCLIDARKGRKIIVLDEVLNGLHPDAKRTIKALITNVLSNRFQFVMVEYGLDIGKQYEVVKTNSVASVIPYTGIGYYKEMALKEDTE